MSLEDLLTWIPAGHADETLAREIQFDRLPRKSHHHVCNGAGQRSAICHGLRPPPGLSRA